MQLLRLTCERFRNLDHVALEAHPRFNILEGDNGQGKTNLLEAIYLLATFRSFRDARSAELIGWGHATALVRGEAVRREVTRTIAVEISAKGRRAELDGKAVTSLSSFFGHLNVVLFGPDDLAVTKEGPALRRRLLDRAVFGVWPAYLDEARAYATALKSRNKLLKQSGGRAVDPALMASFDQELARRGARVLWRRLTYVDSFRPLFERVLSDMTGGKLEGDLRYVGLPGAREGADEEALEAAFTERLAATVDTDLRRGYTTSGPHTDDLDFSLAGRPVRQFASQGQHRAFVLALKVAEMQRIAQALGVFPVLLLDDVSSELDRTRNAQLMSYLDGAGGQVFITTTDRRWVQVGRTDETARVFTVRGGVLGPGADS